MVKRNDQIEEVREDPSVSFLGFDFSDAVKTELKPDGTRALVEIEEAKEVTGTNSESKYYQEVYHNFRFGLVDDPMARTIYHSLFPPMPGDHKRVANEKKLAYGEFFACFGTGFNRIEDMVGAKGLVILGIGKDQNGRDKNVIAKFLPPSDR